MEDLNSCTTISININCTTTTINMGFMNLLSDMNGTTNNNNYNNMSIPCPDFKNTSSINGTFMSKCAMAKENTHSINEACRNDAGFINYLEFNYCTMDGLTPVSMIILVCSLPSSLPSLRQYCFLLFTCVQVIWLLVLFYLLVSTTEQYFCPSLSKLSKRLRLSNNLAGNILLHSYWR